MYQFLNPVYAYIISGGLFAILLLFLVIAKGDEMFCTNFFTKWIFKTFNPIPGSALFWNGLFWTLFISTGLVWPELALGISIILSIFMLAASFDDMEMKYHSWVWCTLFMYFGIALVGVGITLHYIWTNTIGRFNNYLDKKKHADNN